MDIRATEGCMMRVQMTILLHVLEAEEGHRHVLVSVRFMSTGTRVSISVFMCRSVIFRFGFLKECNVMYLNFFNLLPV